MGCLLRKCVWTSLWSDPTNITREATFSSSQVDTNPDISGSYAVYVRWVAHPNRTDSARYRIFDGTTQTYLSGCTVNQTSRGGEWVYCATVNLTSGNYATVKLGNNCEAGKYVIADAVRFVRVSKDADDLIDEPGIEWSRSDSETIIASDSAATPTQIRSATITCPGNGYVFAQATGRTKMWPTAADNNVRLAFSLNTSTSWDSSYYTDLGQYMDNTQYDYRNMVISRVVSCYKGESLTFYLLGFRATATTHANSTIFQPHLHLMYFPSHY
jgi:hypothetical protein